MLLHQHFYPCWLTGTTPICHFSKTQQLTSIFKNIMIEYKFNESEETLFIAVSGTFGINHMFKTIDSFADDNSLPRNLKICEDARYSNVTFSEDEIQLIIERLKSHLFKFNSIRHAVIHLDPVNTAFATLVGNRLSGGNYVLKVFSSEEYALHWLRLA